MWLEESQKLKQQTFLLGSHDAMAYSLDTNSSVLEPKKLKALDKMFSTFLRPIVKKWGTAQVKYQFKYSNITINVRSQSMFMFSNDCPGKEHLRAAWRGYAILWSEGCWEAWIERCILLSWTIHNNDCEGCCPDSFSCYSLYINCIQLLNV